MRLQWNVMSSSHSTQQTPLAVHSNVNINYCNTHMSATATQCVYCLSAGLGDLLSVHRMHAHVTRTHTRFGQQFI